MSRGRPSTKSKARPAPGDRSELASRWDGQTRLLRALAHPVRLHILETLSDGARCVTDLRELVRISQPNVSQHLATLKEAALVDSCSNGPLRCYYLREPSLVRDLLELLRRDRVPDDRDPATIISEAQERREP